MADVFGASTYSDVATWSDGTSKAQATLDENTISVIESLSYQ